MASLYKQHAHKYKIEKGLNLLKNMQPVGYVLIQIQNSVALNILLLLFFHLICFEGCFVLFLMEILNKGMFHFKQGSFFPIQKELAEVNASK